jgi:His-Xaa-Ser system radical SAM maturase HxsC
MLLHTRGKAINIDTPIVGRVTRVRNSDDDDAILLVDGSNNEIPDGGYSAVLSTHNEIRILGDSQVVYQIPSLSHLLEGDLVAVGRDGHVNTLYRTNSNHNTLLATERCNSNCLMCSQPPRDRNDVPYSFEIHTKAIPLIPKDCLELGISGGEPTLMGEFFYKILEQTKQQLPNTEIHVLTNGRSFAWMNLAERLAQINHEKVMFGIPIYSDYYQLHDYIVQAPNAFYQTIQGLHNLARCNQRIEIRIVLHKQSITRLVKLARFIYKNLPFAEHVAFMELEYIGYTPHNIGKLWIDPFDYQSQLSEAVEFLSGQGMNVSIYNAQLCVLRPNLWKYARKSISDWKNDYLQECQSCQKLSDCGGLFTWNLKKHSDHIKRFDFQDV